jgi:hypothetical protein
MKKVFCVLLPLLLLGTAISLYAASGRESTQLPPQEVEIMYSTEDHAFQAKDISDDIRWKVLSDGSMAIYDGSGNTVFGITNAGKPYVPPKENYAVVSFKAMGAGADSSAVTSYTTSTTYNTYLMDTSQSYGMGTGNALEAGGVSVYLPAGTQAMDGMKMTFQKINTSGATYICLIPANDAVRASGVTDHILAPAYSSETHLGIPTSGATYSTGTFNAYLPVANMPQMSATIMYRYVAATGGTWYVLSGATQWK